MLTAAFIALAVLALTASVAASRAAAARCYRIDRDAYRRAQGEWATERRRTQLHPERSA